MFDQSAFSTIFLLNSFYIYRFYSAYSLARLIKNSTDLLTASLLIICDVLLEEDPNRPL
jgi:hypothetical protein